MASTRLRVSQGGFGSRPAKNMLYSASSCLRAASRRCMSRSISLMGGTGSSLYREAGTTRAAATARARRARADRRSAPRWRPTVRRSETDRAAGSRRSTRSARGSDGSRPIRFRETPRTRARASSARSKSGISSDGNTSVIENGSERRPNSASCRSGSIAASSSSVGCSGSSAYGQKRSRGRNLGGSGVIDTAMIWQKRWTR